MRHVAFALCASLCLATASFAQDAAAPPAGAPPAASSAGAGGSAKDIRSACREQAKGQGLKGQEMRQAMMDCVAKQNPAMAGAMKCRMAAKGKGLKAGTDEMRAFMKDCKKNAS